MARRLLGGRGMGDLRESSVAVRTCLVREPTLAWSLLAEILRRHPRFALVAEFDGGESRRLNGTAAATDLVLLDAAVVLAAGEVMAGGAISPAPGVPVLAVGSLPPAPGCASLLRCGVRGFVGADQPWEILEEAMIEVASGGSYFTAEFRRACDPAPAPGDSCLPALSQRELAVLRAVAGGATSKEAARQLGLSPRSVETYRYRLMRKLGIRSLASMLQFALRQGLVAPVVSSQ